ncbi:hypothetical protein AC1659_29070 [Rhodococcus erythropolis]|uniref:hypothetical protein n=1 Tax=Rhodococcus erythropolis TaxID=1833 RepID=UPI001BAAFE1D|nr:hypothetical protein [Rhodococcus erythropolis]MBS2993355.1 hypothetical protein [Rhodococcus erythropolis]
MAEEHTAAARSAVEAELYQSTKHLRVITDADLAAVVEGLTGEVVDRARIDFAFPAPGSTDHLFD